jgi:WD40 repeat protein
MSHTDEPTLGFDNSLEQAQSMEDALAQTLLELETSLKFDRDQLLSRYPLWANELNQFIDNWLAMEQATGKLAFRETNLASPQSLKLSSLKLSGERLGDYLLLDEISSGGMGVVYRAKQVSLDRTVALKMVLDARRDLPRFRIEAEAAASLHHNNIISIYEVGELEGQPFLSMQYVEGGNLRDRLKQGPLSPRVAAELVETVALAVHYAHQRGILHRDLKPANVLLDEAGKPYVTDFGLAKQLGGSAELTRSGAILGTPGYMAPEQAMGQVKSITIAADVYGLGAILYAALTGEAPFSADSDLKTLRRVIEELPRSPRAACPDLDRNIETVCLKCLEKNPTSRYASAKHLADDLRRYLTGEPVKARPVSMLERQWRWCTRYPAFAALAFTAVVAVCVALAVAVGLALSESQARIDSENARLREVALRESRDISLAEAKEMAAAAQRTVSEVFTTNAMWASELHQSSDALFWLSQATQTPGLREEIANADLTRYASFLRYSPIPLAAKALENEISMESFQSDMRSFDLHPFLPQLMFKSGDEFRIWNFQSDDCWYPAEKGFPVSFGKWSRDGRMLLLGGRSGEVRVLEASSRELLANFLVDDRVDSANFAQTHDWIAVSSSQSIQRFDLKSGDNIGSALRHSAPIASIAISNNDLRMVTVTCDGKAHLYDTSSPEARRLFEFPCYIPPNSALSQELVPQFTSDGNYLFIRTTQHALQVFDTNTGESALVQPLAIGKISSLATTPDCRRWLFGGEAYGRMFSFKQGKAGDWHFLNHMHRLPHSAAIVTAAIRENLLVTGGLDQKVQLWPISSIRPNDTLWNESEVPLAVLPHQSQVVRIVLSPDSKRMVTVQQDGLLKVWEIPDFSPPGYSIEVPSGGSMVKVIGEEHWLMAGTTHWQGHMVNASVRRTRDGLVVGETTMASLIERGHLLDSVISADQNILATCHAASSRSSKTMLAGKSKSGTVQLWSMPNGKPIFAPIECHAEPRCAAFSPNGQELAILTVDRNVLIVNVATGEIQSPSAIGPTSEPLDNQTGYQPNHAFNGQLKYSSDGEQLFTWGIGMGFDVWNVPQVEHLFAENQGSSSYILDLCLSSADEHFYVAESGNANVRVLDRRTGALIRNIEHSTAVTSIELDTQGELLLTGSEYGRVSLWKLSSGERCFADIVHPKAVVDVAFSHDNQLLATLSKDDYLRLYRSKDGSLACKPLLVASGSKNIQFANSNSVIVAGANREVRVIQLNRFFEENVFEPTQAALFAEILSGKTMNNGRAMNMTSKQWMEAWRNYNLNRAQ